jgi:hypothetical protein
MASAYGARVAADDMRVASLVANERTANERIH